MSRLFSSKYESYKRRDDQEKLEPNRHIFIAFEGFVTESKYFDGLSKYIEDKFLVQLFPIDRDRLDGKSHPEHVLDGLKEYYYAEVASGFREKEDELWVVIDIDDHFKATANETVGEVYAEFLTRLYTKDGNVIHAAISKPSFELWLILHFKSANQLDIVSLTENAKVTRENTYAKKLWSDVRLEQTPRRNIYDCFPRTENAIQNARSGFLAQSNDELITRVGTTVSKLLGTIVS